MKKSTVIILILVGAIALLLLSRHGWGPMHMSGNDHMMSHRGNGEKIISKIILPESFTQSAENGEKLFNENCVSCHGKNATGVTGNGPPLIHKIYEPNHHTDESFQRAVAIGVRAHHWPFGNMPRISGLSRDDVSDIISYIREIQRVNGIN